MTAGLLGMIASPAQGNLLPNTVIWCADNGCFSKGYPGDQTWLAWLDSYTAEQRARCTFAVAPDVLGDAAATLARSVPWLPHIRGLGYSVAFVAQDGQQDLPVPWDRFEVLFIGGTTKWKLGPHARHLIAKAKTRSKQVHMGRVNSERRWRYAQTIGCDSVDGTYLTYGPDVLLPVVLAWTRNADQLILDSAS